MSGYVVSMNRSMEWRLLQIQSRTIHGETDVSCSWSRIFVIGWVFVRLDGLGLMEDESMKEIDQDRAVQTLYVIVKNCSGKCMCKGSTHIRQIRWVTKAAG